MTKITLLVDEDVRKTIVLGVRLREPVIDILTTRDGGTLGLSDPDVLVVHAQLGRVLVSSDCNTMVGHFYALVRSGTPCPGLIIVPQELPDRDVIEDLLMIWAAFRASELVNQVFWLPF